MKNLVVFILACIFALISPLLQNESPIATSQIDDFPGWPQKFQGENLTQLPLTEREKLFRDSFPGKTARFTGSKRQYIFRWITCPTRKLHPAMDCFKASNYKIKHLPHYKDSQNISWSAFEAEKDDQILYVREHIYDIAGNSWPDVSAWYWAATFNKATGPWWSVTTIERAEKTNKVKPR